MTDKELPLRQMGGISIIVDAGQLIGDNTLAYDKVVLPQLLLDIRGS